MKKGDIGEARIETMEFPNKGIVHIDGEKVVIKNGIPGQLVRFGISKKRKGKCEARLLEVVEPSPLEQPGELRRVSVPGVAVRRAAETEGAAGAPASGRRM